MLINLVGQRFGRLLVIKRVEKPEYIKQHDTYWLCKCDCGKEKIISKRSLRNGGTISCGCYQKEIASKLRFKDLTGEKFGKLLVIKRIEKPSNSQRTDSYWLCNCDCGREKIATGSSLRVGDTKTCGYCEILPYGEASFNRIFYHYKIDAKKRNLVFSLTKERFLEIITKKCFYCGKEPSNIQKTGNNGNFVYNGIDRVDSLRGYIDKNVVPCCWQCNHAKYIMPLNEFYEWIKRTYEYSFLGQERKEK